MKNSILRLIVAVTISLASSIAVDASLGQEPTRKPTFGPTQTAPPACGTIVTNDGNDLTLGPYQFPSDERTADAFHCNTGTGHWFSHSYYSPMYLYAFQLTQQCEYQFRTPEGNLQWQTVRDVNSWFEQAAKTFQRPDNVGYKASDDDIIFSGLEVPNYETDLISENIEDCPENYCVKVVGPSITRKSIGSVYNPESNSRVAEEDEPELLYAFSNIDAHDTFYKMMKGAMRSSNSRHIFLTNHFLRCGCESFCMEEDRPYDSVHVQATCYVEELCGQRVFQISYTDDYPEDEKATWASTGTSQVMEWFNECASAMYDCTEHEDSDRSLFRGTNYRSIYNGFPKVFQYSSWKGADNVYGLGGDKYDGFPDSTSTDEPQVAWTCPTYSHKTELRKFGEFVASTEFFRDAGLETSVPVQQNPCEPEIFNPPDPLELPPPIGPNCGDVDHVGFCYQMPGATCYAAKAVETCAEVDLVMVNETSTYIYGNVEDWADACLATGSNCKKDERHTGDHGTLLFTGAPQALPVYLENDGYEWYFLLGNLLKNGVDTVDGYIFYDCDTWENAFNAQNFTNGAGNLSSVFENTYGDLWVVREEEECSRSPTNMRSESPSASPTSAPSVPPTSSSDSPTQDPTRSPTTSELTSSRVPRGIWPSGSPTGSPEASPTVSLTASPTSPTLEPSISFPPTEILPNCYNGPKTIQKDSSLTDMCNYNEDMIQINDMGNAEVILAINNVWTQDALPEQLRVFVHSNGVDSIFDDQDGAGFQCLNTEGSDIDFEGNSEFAVDCYQESEDAPWLAVIEIVISDESLGTTNNVPHPCDEDLIQESCSWRIVVPCSYNALCTAEPNSSTPTATPTVTPTTTPTATPTLHPSAAPTIAATTSPTASPTTKPTSGEPTKDDETDDNDFFHPIGPDECSEDILLVQHMGVTSYPNDAVQILSQDETTVTVKLTQTFTDSNSTIDNMYYQYKQNHFDVMCYEEQNFYGEDSVVFTLQCTAHSQISLLELWVVDDVTKDVLSIGDNAVIPNCCHPMVPEGTPVTKYMVEIKCVSACPEAVE